MKDKLGKEVNVGDRVVVATTCYKSGHLRLGEIKVIEGDRARVTTEVGGSTWVTSSQVAKV